MPRLPVPAALNRLLFSLSSLAAVCAEPVAGPEVPEHVRVQAQQVIEADTGDPCAAHRRGVPQVRRALTLHDRSAAEPPLAEAPTQCLCASAHTAPLCNPRCFDVLTWRKAYRKYKPRTRPGKCNLCAKKSVKQAYCTICRPCAKSKGLCEKCGCKPQEVRPTTPAPGGYPGHSLTASYRLLLNRLPLLTNQIHT